MRLSTNRTLLITFMVLATFSYQAFSCTSILVTKGASKTGCVIISYSCDGGGFMSKPSIIPAATYKPGEMLEIKSFRGQVLGKIPQPEQTYKVVGLMNEYQLAIGETTFGGREELVDREGLLHYWTLMRLGLQRAKTAREAIKVITSLSEEYGYASTGESISIADKEEAWILEIIGTGPTGGKGAIWVARRVPDGMISVHANMSRIHEFPLDDPKNCIYSDNVISFAVEKGYYDPDSGKPFSFSAAYCPPTEEQIRYSARRVWRVFDRVAPSMKISSDYSWGRGDGEPYPLFITPDEKLDVRDVMTLHRDHYEGTEFDMTKDLTAGPFGAPDRYRPMKFEVDGEFYTWERPISTMNAAFVFVSESRSFVPDEVGGVYWYGLDDPYTNFFVPLYSTITDLPKSYVTGSIREFSRDSAWWGFNFIATFAQLRWSYMIEDIRPVQKEIEDRYFALQPAIETAAKQLAESDPELAASYLTDYVISSTEKNVQRWWELADWLITKYNDGYIVNENGRSREVGFSPEWLRLEIERNGERLKLKGLRKGDKGDL